MIRINKTDNIPLKLSEDGATATAANIAAFEASPDEYISSPTRNGRQVKKFEITGDIYGHATVKDQLKEEQDFKCCFCEAYFIANGHGDVEHFRPKSAYKKKGERRLTYPGYYWLAYHWFNLYFSCQICNGSFKGNHFPLFDEANRMLSHLDAANIDNENPVLIDPGKDNPEEFIQFREEVPYAVNDNDKGKTSIKAYGLDRDDLNRIRFDYLQLLDVTLTFADFNLTNPRAVDFALQFFNISLPELEQKVAIANRYFNNAAKKHFPFTNMIRCKFPTLPR